MRQDKQDGINSDAEDTRGLVDGKDVEAVTRLSRIPDFRSGNALKDKYEHEYAGRADVDVEHQLRDNVQSAYAVRREDSFVKEDDGSAGEQSNDTEQDLEGVGILPMVNVFSVFLISRQVLVLVEHTCAQRIRCDNGTFH